MVDVTNSDLLNFLMEIKEDIGQLKASHTNIQTGLDKTHQVATAADRRIGVLEIARARQNGALAVIGVMTSAIGAGVEYFVSHVLGKHT